MHDLAALVPPELIQIISDDFGCDRVEPPHLPMPVMHMHLGHSSRRWQSISNQALLKNLTSPLTGHTCTAMFSEGECVFFLGGGPQGENRSYR